MLVSQMLQESPKFQIDPVLLFSRIKQRTKLLDPEKERHYKILTILIPKRKLKSPDTDIFGETNAAEKSKVSKSLSAVVFKGKTEKKKDTTKF